MTRIALDLQLQEQARASAVDGEAISAAARAHAAAAAMCIQPAQDTLSDGDDDSIKLQGTVTRVIQSEASKTCRSALDLDAVFACAGSMPHYDSSQQPACLSETPCTKSIGTTSSSD